MNILNKTISGITFSDVVSFCEEKIPEGVQIDYKRDFPQKDLSKHLASFSNTRGGIIIVGVEEDKKSGAPVVWEGIAKDAKLIERVHQIAGNVEPFPSYDVCFTDEVNGKYFLLIRVYEGSKTPYYVQNDSNVWVRTGNVSKPIDIASPDGLELLFGRKEKAEKARSFYLKRAEDLYEAALEREEKRRLALIEEAKKKGNENHGYFPEKLGSNAIVCRIAIQPYFPSKALGTPKDIKDALDRIRFRTGHATFPDPNMEAIPEGLLSFAHGYSGYIESQQIYGQGLIYRHFDALTVDKDKRRIVPLWRIAGSLFMLLRFSKSFYGQFRYQGNLKGLLSLEDMVDVVVPKLKPSNRMFFDDDNQSFIPSYSWEIDLDTNVLNDPVELKKYYFSFVREIYWYFGYENVAEEVLEDFLKESGFSF